MKKTVFVVLAALLSVHVLYAQEYIASGVVHDSSTGEPMEFIAVYFKHTDVGIATDYRGEFFLKNSQGADTLVIDAIGYEKQYLALKPGANRDLKILLRPESIQLSEVTVKPKKERYRKKDNPAVALIREVIARKDSNRVESMDYYSCNLYEKLTLSLDNYSPDFEKKKKLAYLREYIDTSEITGKPVLTVSIRETMGDYYYRRSPQERKTVRKAQRHTGLDKEFDNNGGLTANLELLFTGINIFDNEIAFMMNRFVSPVSSALATTYYKYHIVDTVVIDGLRCIDLAFVPFNKQGFGFSGRLYITDDGNYSVKKVRLNFPPSSNINWIDKLRIDQEFMRTEDGLWALKQEDSYVNFTVFQGVQGIFAHQSRHFANYNADRDSLAGNRVFRIDGPIEVLPDAKSYGEEYWNANRMVPLNKREADIAKVSDEISKKSSAVVWMRVLDAFVSEWVPTSGSKETSKFDFGPILSFAGYNYIEGPRFRIGGMTTANLFDRWFANGYLAYGINDRKIKGSITLTHSFNKKNYHSEESPVNNLSISYTYDIFSPEAIGEQHDLVTSLKAGSVRKYNYIRKAGIKYEKQWTNSLRTSFTVFNLRYTPATLYGPKGKGTLRYEMVSEDGTLRSIPGISTNEIGAQIRWAPGEKTINSVSKRTNADKDTPIFTLKHTVGINALGGDYFYNRTEFSAFKRIRLSVAGYMDAKLSAGKVWNTVPWPLLLVPEANQSFAYRRETFHMMRALEFVTDQYVQVNLSWHMKGMIFNRIPLIKKLKLRELVIFNGIYGGLTEKNNPDLTKGLFVLPKGTSALGNMPYMEVGVGIENIFRLFRLVYFYRITQRDQDLGWLGKWGGLRFGVYVDF